ncbi:MAG: type II toxin-antitoxin system HipA family toxin, partial [Endozoicomonas sp.]
MDNDSIRLLEVSRRYSDGSEAIVGKLAQNRQGVFFQYDTGYLSKGSSHSLSPFKLPFDGDLHGAPKDPHQGLHGVFSDSLPDGWGTLLMDRVFRQNGRLPHHITVMDRLAYTGNRGMGALSYSPVIEYSREQGDLMDIAVLGQEAQLIFDGETDHVLSALAQAGGSGGARPKAIVYLDPVTPNFATTVPGKAGLEPWVVKFTSKNLPLGHEEGLCEAAWLAMAQSAGIDVPKWQLIPADAPTGASAWLALRRFDCSENGRGRYHMQTLSGLLDADYRLPSLDYEDVIKATQVLCNSP